MSLKSILLCVDCHYDSSRIYFRALLRRFPLATAFELYTLSNLIVLHYCWESSWLSPIFWRCGALDEPQRQNIGLGNGTGAHWVLQRWRLWVYCIINTLLQNYIIGRFIEIFFF